MSTDAQPTAIRTPDQRLRVFVSSTMKELAAERAAAKEAISRLRLTPVLFEMGARPHPPRELYRAYLEQSQVFVGIYARQYGWVGPEMEISGLHDEFLLSKDKPRLIYIKSVDEREERLQAMLDEITSEAGVSYQRFSTPEELHDLIENDLALLLSERFAPLAERAPDISLAGIPAPAAPIIGREKEIAELVDLLGRDDTRLVTLTGPGGVGKTRLALAAARRLGDDFPDGVAYVPFAGVTNASLIAPEIAAGLGIHDSGERPILDTLVQHLAGARLLLVLDNFEHLVDGANVVSDLLSAAPKLRVLVTSRRLLRLYGEREYAVLPLAVPQEAGAEPGLGPAVDLFVQRAAWAHPGFELTRENTPVIAEICRRLDGMPLAIELAAARLRLLSEETLLQRLSDSLDVLSAGPRDLPARQQTMRNAIHWSYELLGEWEQDLFAQVSVFSGGFSVEAAEAVCHAPDVPAGDLLSALASLAEQSLLSLVHGATDAPRFRMLGVVREYAFEQLRASGREEELRARHVRYFTGIVQDAEAILYTEGGERWMPRIETEQDNLRAAIEWTLTAPGDSGADPDHPIVDITLAFYWYLTGHVTEGRGWADRLLERALRAGDDRNLAYALQVAGALALWQSDLDIARERLERSVDIWRRLGNREALAMSHMVLGATSVNRGDAATAESVLSDALEFFEKTDMRRNTSVVLMHLGNAAAQRRDYELATRHYQKALDTARGPNDEWMLASLLNNLGEVARCRDDHAKAYHHYEEASRIFEKQHAASDIARIVHNLAYCDLRERRPDRAASGFLESLDGFERVGNQRGVAECIIGLAAVDSETGEAARAAQLLGAGEAMLRSHGASFWPADQHEQEITVAAIRRALGNEEFEKQRRRGEKLSPDDALTLARER